MFYNVGLLDSMKTYFDMARRVNPELFDLSGSGQEYYLMTGNYEEFEQLVRRRCVNDKEEYNFQLAVFYEMRREWQKEDSLLAISSHPDDMSAGLAKLHLGDKAQGKLFLQKAIDRRMRFQSFSNAWHYYDISRLYGRQPLCSLF